MSGGSAAHHCAKLLRGLKEPERVHVAGSVLWPRQLARAGPFGARDRVGVLAALAISAEQAIFLSSAA